MSSTSSNGWSRNRSIGLLAFTLTLIALAGFRHDDRADVKAQGTCSSCAAPAERVIYAPTISMPESGEGNIVLNCRSPQAIQATPTFYKKDGEAVIGDPITLQPAEMRFVTIESLMPEQHRGTNGWGGMSFSFYGAPTEVWAQITMPGSGERGSSDVVFSVVNGVGSDTLEAVWWQPRPGKRVIALGNSSNTTIKTTVEYGNGETETVEIAPHATEYLRQNFNGTQPDGPESVKLTTLGPAGALKAAGYVMSSSNSPNHRFASSIRFYDTKSAAQPKLFATNFRVKNTTSHLVIKNTSTQALTASPVFHPTTGDGASVDLAPVTLEAGETRELDLAPLMTAAASRNDLKSVSVTINNTGSPGSLIGAIAARNSNIDVGYDVPLRDTGGLNQSTGAYPVRLDDDYKTIVTVTNVGDVTAKLGPVIRYSGGQYSFPQTSLEPGRTAVYDINKIRNENIPDQFGNPLPDGLTTAQFVWSVLGPGRLAGRSEVVSASRNVSSSYSCWQCCPNNGPTYDALEFNTFVGGYAQQTIYETWFDCYQNPIPYTSPVPGLASADPAIATMDYSYGQMRAYGVAPGVTSWYSQEYYSYSYIWMEQGGTGCVDQGNNTGVQAAVYVLGVTNVTSDTGTYKVTNILGNQTYIHFVTPKGSGNVTLTATLNDNSTAVLNEISWEGATESQNNPLVATVSRGTASKNVIKIKYQTNNVLKEMRVWVVWSVIAPTETSYFANTGATFGSPTGTGFSYSGGYSFVHTIQPSTIISDTDRPNFSGSNVNAPPGGNHPIFGDSLSGGANKKWDHSQQIRYKILNPNSIAANDTLFAGYGQPSDLTTYPSTDTEGNDDRTVTDPETNDPYADGGVLTGEDKPKFGLLTRAGNNGDTYEFRVQLRTFTRLEIEGTWYRISDFCLWKMHLKFKKQNGVWINDDSIRALNNADF